MERRSPQHSRWRTTLRAVSLACLLLTGCLKGGEIAPTPPDEPPAHPDRSEIWTPRPVDLVIFPTTRFKRTEGRPVLSALVELRDAMGDSVKASGGYRFELFAGGRGGSPRFDRRLYAWDIPIYTAADHQAHFDSLVRAYRFELALDAVLDSEQAVTLSIAFQTPDGERLTASGVFEPGSNLIQIKR